MYPFTVLGIPEDATDADVRAAWRQLVTRYPPDRAPETFTLVQQAVDALRGTHERRQARLFHFDPTGNELQAAAHLPADEPRLVPFSEDELTTLLATLQKEPRHEP